MRLQERHNDDRVFAALGLVDADGIREREVVHLAALERLAVAVEVRAIAGSILPLFDPGFTPDPPVAVLTQGFGPGVDRYIPTFPYLGVPKDGYHTPAVVGASNVSGAGAATVPGVVPQH